MHATGEATARYAAQFPAYRAASFFRPFLGVEVSSLGLGTYLGEPDEATDRAYTDAILAAAEHGINFFDCAINYRHQRSERALGAALKHLDREQIFVCTKAGFLTPGAVPDFLQDDDVVGRMHSISPEFLTDQIERSRVNLGVDTVDLFYIHNPETQLGFRTREGFEARMRRAFAQMERLVDRGWIRNYGAATWEGFRRRDALSLPRLAEIATEEGGREHHFRAIQAPFNLGMVEAFVDRPENVLEAAERLGIAVVASSTLMQARILDNLPDALCTLLPGLASDAARAIQFTRSTPGIAVAVTGMSKREHVVENTGVARVPPLTRADYQRLYQ